MLSKFFALSLLLSSLSFAGEQLDLEVYGRTYLSNCGSVTAEAGDFQIVVKNHGNTPTPWGTRMTLLYGWKGYSANFTGGADAQFDWAYNGEMEMPAIASYTWRANLTRVLHERTSTQALTHLQFVVRIDAPGRSEERRVGKECRL